MLPFGIHRAAQPAAIAAAWLCLFDASAHASALMPRQTAGSPTLVVVDFPFAATPAPVLPDELRRRQLNTICGYIGGNPDLPATCSAGSHCVAEMNKGVIGCCPDSGPCTTGIFTTCADTNHPAKGGDPFEFVCGAGQVCYKNSYAGGFSQFGCGSASNLATSVATEVAGKSAVILGTPSGSEAAAPSASSSSPASSAATPTGSAASSSAGSSAGSSAASSGASSATSDASPTASSASSGPSSGSSPASSSKTRSGTRTKSSDASSTASGSQETSTAADQSSTSDSEVTSSSSTESAAPRPTPITNGIPAGTSVSQNGSPNTQAPDVDGTAKTNTAAIIGGVLGGISGLILIVAIILFIRRNKRNRDNERRSPSAQGSLIRYENHRPCLRPTAMLTDSSRPYMQGEGAASGDDVYGTSLSPRPAPAPPVAQAAMSERWPLARANNANNAAPAGRPGSSVYTNNAAPAGRPGSSMYSDNLPFTQGPQDFAPAPVTRDIYAPPGAAMIDAPPPPRRSGNSPLWQQNRYDR